MSGAWAAATAAAGAAAFAVSAVGSSRRPMPAAARAARSTRRPARRLAPLGASTLGRRVRRDRLSVLAEAADVAWTPDELVGAKVVSALLVALAGAIVVPTFGAILGLAGWPVPEIVLARRVRRRVADASGEVPLFLDLLAVATSAGLAPQLAVRLASDPLRGPLAVELATAVRRTDLGRRWRVELAGVAERLALADLRRAVATLERSEALGSSLATEMSRLAADVRAERRALAAERARTAPVKMLFPLVFLILPAFLLLTVVPVLLSTVRSIG